MAAEHVIHFIHQPDVVARPDAMCEGFLYPGSADLYIVWLSSAGARGRRLGIQALVSIVAAAEDACGVGHSLTVHLEDTTNETREEINVFARLRFKPAEPNSTFADDPSRVASSSTVLAAAEQQFGIRIPGQYAAQNDRADF